MGSNRKKDFKMNEIGGEEKAKQEGGEKQHPEREGLSAGINVGYGSDRGWGERGEWWGTKHGPSVVKAGQAVEKKSEKGGTQFNFGDLVTVRG